MHIPDQVLEPEILAVTAAAAACGVGVAVRRVTRTAGEQEETIPRLGILGAFVFAAQMVNFPVGPGVSAHMVGSAFLTLLVGPSAAILTLTAVLAIQALLFSDGGILALGANVLNIAVIGCLTAHAVYKGLSGRSPGPMRARFAAGAAAAASVLAAALACILELLPSLPAGREGEIGGRTLVSTALLVGHVFFALGESVLTVLCLEAVRNLVPGVFSERHTVPEQ